MSMASPKLFDINAILWLSGEKSALSPKWVNISMFFGRLSSGLPGFLLSAKGNNRIREVMNNFIFDKQV